MFVTQAHTFAQQARLAVTLAWVAGYTNLITILTCAHVSSHVTGTTGDLGRAAAQGRLGVAAYAGYLLFMFFSGAAVAGFTTELGRRRGWGSIYVLPMALQALLLTAFALGVELHEHDAPETGWGLWWMTGVASAAMGLQNAAITRISSGVVRTTHVTGVLTDLGLESVQFLWWLRDRAKGRPGAIKPLASQPTARRLALLASIMGSFALGAGLGTLAYANFPSQSMIPPVLFLVWIIYQDASRPIAEIEPSELTEERGLGIPSSIAVYQLAQDPRRKGDVHRLPDLSVWVDRLPEHARVVILDLASVRSLEAESAAELVSAAGRLSAQGRRFIVAGITPAQFSLLRRTAGGDGAGVDAAPDLELAIARGLNVVEDLALDAREGRSSRSRGRL